MVVALKHELIDPYEKIIAINIYSQISKFDIILYYIWCHILHQILLLWNLILKIALEWRIVFPSLKYLVLTLTQQFGITLETP